MDLSSVLGSQSAGSDSTAVKLLYLEEAAIR